VRAFVLRECFKNVDALTKMKQGEDRGCAWAIVQRTLPLVYGLPSARLLVCVDQP